MEDIDVVRNLNQALKMRDFNLVEEIKENVATRIVLNEKELSEQQALLELIETSRGVVEDLQMYHGDND